MGNIITNFQVNEEIILMSNSSTSVFIETLCLSGSDIAIEDYQKDLMIWLGQRDWCILGMGVEGFDIVEIIWDRIIFDKQKNFLLRVIDLTFAKTNWESLNYKPNEEFAFINLAIFRKMIETFTIDKIDESKESEIYPFEENINCYDRCKIHRVYMHFGGCVVCNNT